MSRTLEVFWITCALVLATTLALVAVPILAFIFVVAISTSAALLAFRRRHKTTSTAGFERRRYPAPMHGPLIIETTYQRLDPDPRR